MGTHHEAVSRRGSHATPGRNGPDASPSPGTGGPPLGLVLPPLPLPSRSDPAAELPAGLDAPSWSPLRVAVPLFAAVWICFAVLAAAVSGPPADQAARLGHLLGNGAAVVGLVLLTLSVAHAQVSGRPPRPAAVATVAAGIVQSVVAAVIGSGLWGVGAVVLLFVGVAVPLAWVGGQFQSGVRRQRVERHNSLISSWTARARQQAHEHVESVHRHDLRSMLFVIDGAGRALADPTLSREERASFAEILTEGVERLASLTAVRMEEIHPFSVGDVVRAVVHGERRAGRRLAAEVPAGLTAVGRAADVAAVLRTLVAVAGRKDTGSVQVRAELQAGAVALFVEPVGTTGLPLLARNWEEIRVESFKSPSTADEEREDLFVAARLLADQGADLWSTAGRTRFAVRLPVPTTPSPEVTA